MKRHVTGQEDHHVLRVCHTCFMYSSRLRKRFSRWARKTKIFGKKAESLNWNYQTYT